MAAYVVFKSNVKTIENEVNFLYDLGDALDFMRYKNSSTDYEWAVAEVIPMDSWLGKLLTFLHMRSN
jgi:hypothetical protein